MILASGPLCLPSNTCWKKGRPSFYALTLGGQKAARTSNIRSNGGRTSGHADQKTGAFAEDCIGATAEKAAKALKPGQVLVLENTRFHPEEEKNDPEMARQLAALADIYVNDAFGSAHRAHASTEGVAHHLPAVAGFLMEKEIQYLGAAIADPKHPFVAILGGAKISDKIGVIRNLLKIADHILIAAAWQTPS